MCGIAGVLAGPGPAPAALAAAMTAALAHRGPDSDGLWQDEAAGIALGHRRLAIVDLSALGHQPMASESGRYMLAYNGEIYNFRTLRAGLAQRGHRFRGHSDTEVLLALIEDAGLEAALPQLAGMFAIALWDRRDRVLHLVRDAVGKKPLYVGVAGDAICFGSELKALAAVPGFRREVDRAALGHMLRRQYVPAPFCIWRDAIKLPAGTRLMLRAGPARSAEDLRAGLIRWFDPVARATEGQARPLEGTDDALLDRLEAVLETAVGERMIADVPLGAFLSGGVDSSLVVALMGRLGGGKVRTFTAAFGEAGFDESGKAGAVARHLGTEHLTLPVSADEARAVIPLLPDIADEPFADASIIPGFLICRLARQDVTVALSGDGGDESFGGYGRYLLAARLGRRLDPLPQWARDLGGWGLDHAPAGLLSALAGAGGGQAGYRGAVTADRLRKLAGCVRAPGADARYAALQDIGAVPGRRDPWPGAVPPGTRLDAMHRMMLADTLSYLPDDVLAKVDRASMAVALEARAPLLDGRVMDLAWRLPPRMKLRDGRGKWALRKLLERHLPAGLIDQGKEGFSVPVADWLRGPLRDWGDGLLTAARVREDGLLDPDLTARLWREHQSGGRNHAAPLWSLLMFRAWQDRWQTPGPAARPAVPEALAALPR
jgi:asparagine synthase (glutamine-hydrolysing)